METSRKAQIKSRPLINAVVSAPYTYLFINIIAIFLITPFGEARPQMIPLVETGFFSMLVLVLWALRKGKGIITFFIVMILFSIISDLFLFRQYDPDSKLSYSVYLKLLTPAVDGLLVLSVIVILLTTIFKERQVSRDTLLGGITVYFLFGILWTFFYRVILIIDSNAISVTAGYFSISQLLYFSFMTLMTVGYGDILPLTPIARNLAILEAFVGQLYLAIFVSRLVGLHISATNRLKN